MSDERSSLERMTECICPSCEQKHHKRMEWTGNGIPRKFCPFCEDLPNQVEFLEEYRPGMYLTNFKPPAL